MYNTLSTTTLSYCNNRSVRVDKCVGVCIAHSYLNTNAAKMLRLQCAQERVRNILKKHHVYLQFCENGLIYYALLVHLISSMFAIFCV